MNETTLATAGGDALAAPARPAAQLSDAAFYNLFVAGQDSDGAAKGYDAAVRALGTFLRPEDPVPAVGVVYLMRRMTAPQVNTVLAGWRTHLLRDRKAAPATVNVHLAGVRALLTWMRRFGLTDVRPDVKSVKSRNYRDTRGTGHGGFLKLLELASDNGDATKALRDRALLMLMYYLALRRGKVAALDVADYHPAIKVLYVRRKGGGEERYPRQLPDAVAEALDRWLDVRGREPGPLFVNLDNAHARGRLSDYGIWHVVSAYGKAAGIRAWPHGLRHAAGTRLLDRTNGNVRLVQQFMEHANANTTLKYDDNRRDLAGEGARLLAADNPD
jgi:integrase/recombinase XerC